MIYFGKENTFHLQTENTSYILRAMPSGQIEGLYYGRKVSHTDDYRYLYDTAIRRPVHRKISRFPLTI